MSMFWIHDYVDRTTVPTGASDTDPAMRVRYLEERLERLEMVCEAMWNLLKDKVKITDADIVAKVAELDVTDGVADGKISRAPVHCVKCERPNSRRRDHCLYCGHPLRVQS